MIAPLDSRAAQDPAAAGVKGSTLARLRGAGFPVPDGFIVTAGDADSASVVGHVSALEAAAGGGVRFAVRSSGRAEDSVAASFAGQFETVLGVRGPAEVAAAIARCFASFSSPRAQAYQQRVGVQEPGGAVIVQRLVEAEAAGVAFTVDPITGAHDRVTIDAAAGLGDAVVSGRATPDRFAVSKTTRDVVERHPAGACACLNDDAVCAVAALAERVEAHQGFPVDIEWAWQGGQAYLLQARAVTAVRARADETPPDSWIPELNTRIDPRFPLYSNGNVSEILPGCVTPLTYSLFARGVERAFRQLAESIGSMDDVGPDPVVVGFFYHRVYLNVSYFMTAADHSPGATRDTVYEDLIGRPAGHHPAWSLTDLLPWRLWRGIRIVGRYLSFQRRLDTDIEACRRRYHDVRAAFDARRPSSWTNEEIAAWIEMNDAGLEPAIVHIRASQFATSSFATLRGITRRWLGDATGALAAALVTGIGSIASASPAAGLYDLAHSINAEPSLRTLFDTVSDDELLLARIESEASIELAALHAALQAFSDRFGHRGYRETDLRSPCWRERPAAVVAQIRPHLEPGSVSPQEIGERQQQVGAAAHARALASLPAWKRGLFSAILAGARTHIAAREEMKDRLLQFFDLTRRVVGEAKVRLARIMAEPDDIHFLLDGEVAAALRGTLAAPAAASIVRRRHEDFECSARVHVPKVQDGVARFSTTDDSVAGADVLAGVPVSPGVVEGRARVVLDPSTARLDAGDILVAPVTDVAWTPLFLRAAALVVDVGGPLSHGSIVAREFGIPAVTAVAGATRRIRSGDRLRVDGSGGTVTVFSGRPDA